MLEQILSGQSNVAFQCENQYMVEGTRRWCHVSADQLERA